MGIVKCTRKTGYVPRDSFIFKSQDSSLFFSEPLANAIATPVRDGKGIFASSALRFDRRRHRTRLGLHDAAG